MAARILVIDHTAALGGAEVALARALDAIDRRAFEPVVLLLEHGPLLSRLRDSGVRVAVLEASGGLTDVGRAEAASSLTALLRNALRSAVLVPRLVRAIRRARVDLVVANSLKSAVLTSLAAPLAGRRWVWHVNDRIASDYLPRPLVVGMRMLARFGPRRIVANSRATRSALPNVPEGRIVVAYPGVRLEHGHADADAAPTEAGVVFGLLGRIAPTKGQLEFVRAAAELRDVLPDVRFRIIGEALFNDAEFAAGARALPAALGVDDRVEFTGWTDAPGAAIAQLTALVHASPVPEPFGQVVVEAMLAGVPVIATNAGGVPEIVDPDGAGRDLGDGVILSRTGLLVPPGDAAALASAMTWIARHPRERADMAARAAEDARRRFDVRLTARIIEDTWRAALGR